MAREAAIITGADNGTAGEQSGFSAEVAPDLSAVETAWRSLEERATATPYQRFDWVRSFVEAGVDGGAEFRVVLMRDGTGRPAMILPLTISRRSGFRVASFVGGKHANFKLPLTCSTLASKMSATQQRSLLVQSGRQLGVDALELELVPRMWDGEPVALAAAGRPSPSNAFGVTLDPDPDLALKMAMSPDGRRKLRNKENTLGKRGEVEFRIARDPEEANAILDAFFKQKADRFRDQGIRDPFVGEAEAFIRRASLSGLAEGRPAIELYSLTLDGRIIAAFGAAADAKRISGMFISFDPEFSKWSPGDQLVARVIMESARRGRRVFDLGVGEAEYKRRFCNEVEELVDVLLPVSARGRLYVSARSAAVELKRRVKQSDAAMELVRSIRRLRAKTAA